MPAQAYELFRCLGARLHRETSKQIVDDEDAVRKVKKHLSDHGCWASIPAALGALGAADTDAQRQFQRDKILVENTLRELVTSGKSGKAAGFLEQVSMSSKWGLGFSKKFCEEHQHRDVDLLYLGLLAAHAEALLKRVLRSGRCTQSGEAGSATLAPEDGAVVASDGAQNLEAAPGGVGRGKQNHILELHNVAKACDLERLLDQRLLAESGAVRSARQDEERALGSLDLRIRDTDMEMRKNLVRISKFLCGVFDRVRLNTQRRDKRIRDEEQDFQVVFREPLDFDRLAKERATSSAGTEAATGAALGSAADLGSEGSEGFGTARNSAAAEVIDAVCPRPEEDARSVTSSAFSEEACLDSVSDAVFLGRMAEFEKHPQKLQDLSICELEILIARLNEVWDEETRRMRGSRSKLKLPKELRLWAKQGIGCEDRPVETLKKFLSKNQSACALRLEAELGRCAEKVCGELAPSLLGKGDSFPRAIDSLAADPGSKLQRRVLVFGFAGDSQKPEEARNPVVVRRIPFEPGAAALLGEPAGAGGVGGAGHVVSSPGLNGFGGFLDGAALGGNDLEIREIGLRLQGAYCEFEPSPQLAESFNVSQRASYHYMRWVPPGEIEEHSQPLSQILRACGGSSAGGGSGASGSLAGSRYTHVLLVLPSQQANGASEDEPIEVSLSSELDVRADSLSYKTLVTRQVPCADDEKGGFRRLVAQLGRDVTAKLPPQLFLESGGAGGLGGIGGSGVPDLCSQRDSGFAVGPAASAGSKKVCLTETGEVLAQAFSIFFAIQGHGGAMVTERDLRRVLTARPELLYYASMQLLQHISREFPGAVQRHWREQLSLNDEKFSMGPVQKECRELLARLLSSCSANRRTSVLPDGPYWQEFAELIENTTKHVLKLVSIEKGNYEAKMAEIDELLTDSCITFLKVFITPGQSLDEKQLRNFIEKTSAGCCLRVVFVDFDTLIPAIEGADMLDHMDLCESVRRERLGRGADRGRRRDGRSGKARRGGLARRNGARGTAYQRASVVGGLTHLLNDACCGRADMSALALGSASGKVFAGAGAAGVSPFPLDSKTPFGDLAPSMSPLSSVSSRAMMVSVEDGGSPSLDAASDPKAFGSCMSLLQTSVDDCGAGRSAAFPREKAGLVDVSLVEQGVEAAIAWREWLSAWRAYHCGGGARSGDCRGGSKRDRPVVPVVAVLTCDEEMVIDDLCRSHAAEAFDAKSPASIARLKTEVLEIDGVRFGGGGSARDNLRRVENEFPTSGAQRGALEQGGMDGGGAESVYEVESDNLFGSPPSKAANAGCLALRNFRYCKEEELKSILFACVQKKFALVLVARDLAPELRALDLSEADDAMDEYSDAGSDATDAPAVVVPEVFHARVSALRSVGGLGSAVSASSSMREAEANNAALMLEVLVVGLGPSVVRYGHWELVLEAITHAAAVKNMSAGAEVAFRSSYTALRAAVVEQVTRSAGGSAAGAALGGGSTRDGDDGSEIDQFLRGALQFLDFKDALACLQDKRRRGPGETASRPMFLLGALTAGAVVASAGSRCGGSLLGASRNVPVAAFDDFAQGSAAFRLLPQAHRVRFWIDYLRRVVDRAAVIPDASTSATSSKGSLDSSATKWSNPIEEQIGDLSPLLAQDWGNAHSATFVETLLQCAAQSQRSCFASGARCPDKQAWTGSAQPPTYAGATGDQEGSKRDETYLQRAKGGQDLDWEVFADTWGEGVDLKAEVQRALLLSSPDRLKLMLSLNPAQISSLGTGMLQFADEGDETEGSALRFDSDMGGAGDEEAEISSLAEAESPAWRPPTITETNVDRALVRKVLLALMRDVIDAQPLVRWALDNSCSHPDADQNAGATSFSSSDLEFLTELQKRWAATKWVLWTNLPSKECSTFERECGTLTDAEVRLLIQAGVKMCAQDRPELRHKLVSFLVKMDDPADILSSLPEVKEYLRTARFADLTEGGADDGRVGIGAVSHGHFPRFIGASLIEFLCSTDNKPEFLSGKTGESLMRHEFCAEVVRFASGWYDSGVASRAGGAAATGRKFPTNAVAESLGASSLTPGAMVALLKRARDSKSIGLLVRDVFRDQILETVQDSVGAGSCGDVLVGVLELMENDCRSKVVPLLEAVVDFQSLGRGASKIFGDDPMDGSGSALGGSSSSSRSCATVRASETRQIDLLQRCKNAAFRELYKALRNGDLRPYITHVHQLLSASTAADKESPKIPPLPCESSEKVRELYVGCFSSDESRQKRQRWDDDLNVHDALLTATGCRGVQKVLERGATNPGFFEKALYWFCWGKSPHYAFETAFFPGDTEIGNFFQVLRDPRVGFEEKCCELESLLSPFALFLVKPEVLSFSVYNSFAERLPTVYSGGGASSVVKEEILLLGQEGDETYPPYYLRFHRRTLPKNVREALQSKLKGKITVMTQVKDFFPRVSEGASEEALRHNIAMLLCLNYQQGRVWTSLKKVGGVCSTNKFLGFVLIAWFHAIGFTKQDIGEMVHSGEAQRFQNSWTQFLEASFHSGEAQTLRKTLTFGPLPTFFEVAWKEAAITASLFEVDEESASITAQRLNMILSHLKIAQADVPQFSIEDLVLRGESGKSNDLKEGPRLKAALTDVARAVGARLAVDTEPNGRDGFVKMGADKCIEMHGLVQHYSIVADFMRQLLQCKPLTTGEKRFADFVNYFVSGLAEKLDASDRALRSAIAFDVWWLLIGVTPLNKGFEISYLAKAYQAANGLYVSKKAMAEICWMMSSYYSVIGEFPETVKRLEEAKTACEATQHSVQLKKHGDVIPYISTRLPFVGQRGVDNSEAPYLKGSGRAFSMAEMKERRKKALADSIVGGESSTDGATKRGAAQGRKTKQPIRVAYDVGAAGTSSGGPSRAIQESTKKENSGSGEIAPKMFFVASQKSYPAPRSVANTADVLARPVSQLPGHGGGHTIKCRDLLAFESTLKMYKYGVVKIAPGLQPLLRYVKSDDGGRNFFRLTSALASAGKTAAAGIGSSAHGASKRGRSGRHAARQVQARALEECTEIAKVFATNGDAFAFLNDLPEGTVIQARSFYLRKAGGQWMLVFAAPPPGLADRSVREHRHMLYAHLHFHKVVGMDFDPRVLRVKHILVTAVCEELVALGGEWVDELGSGSGQDSSDEALIHRRLLAIERLHQDAWCGTGSAQSKAKRQRFMEYQMREEAYCAFLLEVVRSLDTTIQAGPGGTFCDWSLRAKIIEHVPSIEVGDEPGVAEMAAADSADDPGAGGEREERLSPLLTKDPSTEITALSLLGNELFRKISDLNTTNREAFRKQLGNPLQGLVRRTGDTRMHKHHAITTKAFQSKSEQALRAVERADPAVPAPTVWFGEFTDSDDEPVDGADLNTSEEDSDSDLGEDIGGLGAVAGGAAAAGAASANDLCYRGTGLSAAKASSLARGADAAGCTGRAGAAAAKNASGRGVTEMDPMQVEDALHAQGGEEQKVYVDTELDRDPSRGAPLFPPEQPGYGRAVNCIFTLLSMWGADLPFYNVKLDHAVLRLKYSNADGLPLSFAIHKDLLADLLEKARARGEAKMLELRGKMLSWLANVLRSPLAAAVQTWILKKVEREDTRLGPPPTNQCPASGARCGRSGVATNAAGSGGSTLAVDPEAPVRKVNLDAILFCLLRLCPIDTPEAQTLKETLVDSFAMDPLAQEALQRKSNLFGVHIVKGGTHSMLHKLGFVVDVRNYASLIREAGGPSKDVNDMIYLDIIRSFDNPYCCIAYVHGLDTISDILLKWLAEYTKHNPWRFVYIEGCDVTWNFPENRDRCHFHFAEESAAHRIKRAADLGDAGIARSRPSHLTSWEAEAIPSAGEAKKVDSLLENLRTKLPAGPEREWFLGDKSSRAAPKADSRAISSMQGDFRGELDRLLGIGGSAGSAPPGGGSLILLVSPPGTGKTHHMNEIKPQLEAKPGVRVHFFDCSSDILVTSTLAEQLDRAINGAPASRTTGAASGSQRRSSGGDDDTTIDLLSGGDADMDVDEGGAGAAGASEPRNILICDEYCVFGLIALRARASSV